MKGDDDLNYFGLKLNKLKLFGLYSFILLIKFD